MNRFNHTRGQLLGRLALTAAAVLSMAAQSASAAPPFTASPIADFAVPEDSPPVLIDLNGVFDDGAGHGLTFDVLGNSNPGVVDAQMTGSNLRIVLAPNANGSASIAVRARHTNPFFGPQTAQDDFQITVTPVNDPPTATAPVVAVTMDENDPELRVPIPANFQDLENDVLGFSIDGNDNPGLVTATIDANDLVLNLSSQQFGTADIVVGATETATIEGFSASYIARLTVNEVDDPPEVVTAIPNQLKVEDDADTVVGLSTYFSDPEGQPLTFSVSANTDSSLVTPLIAGDQLTLQLVQNQSGSSTLTIRATEAGGLNQFVEAAFQLDVSPINDAPEAVAAVQDVAMDEDDPQLRLALLPLFTDIENDVLGYNIQSNSNSALAASSIDGVELVVDLAADQSGVVDIVVQGIETATLGGLSATTIVRVTVSAVDDEPRVVSLIAPQIFNEDDPAGTINLSAFFTDPEGAGLTFSVVGNTDTGVVATSVAGDTLTLTPVADASGSAVVTVRATETLGLNQFVETTVDVSVAAMNDAPVASPISAAVAATEDTGLPNDNLSAVFSDADIGTTGDTLTYGLVSSTGATVFSPTVDPASGSVDFGAPIPDANGVQTIRFNATDLAGASATFDVTITVAAVNDDPVVVNPIGPVSLSEDQPNTSIPLPPVFDDPDIATNGDVLTFSIVSNSNSALFDNVAIVGSSLELDLANNAVGSADIVVRATDLAGATVEDTALVVVAIVQPIAVNDNAVLDEDTEAFRIPVLTNDTLGDPPTSIVSVGTSWTDPSTGIVYDGVSESTPTTQLDESGTEFVLPNGSLAIDGTDILYTPKDNFEGTDFFSYTIRDGDGDESTATVSVTVNNVDDAPRAIGSPAYDVTQGQEINVDEPGGLRRYAVDDDGEELTVIQTSFSPNASVNLVNADGSFTYRPNPTYGDDPGEEIDSFFVVFEDAGGNQSAPVLVTINIDAIEPPTSTPPPGEVEFDFDLADVPLEDAIAAEANVLVIMDDSGSMDWGTMTDQVNGLPYISNANVRQGGVSSYTSYFYYLHSVSTNIYGNSRVLPTEEALDADPDTVGNDYGVWRARYSGWNSIYYDPTVNYEPWTGLDRTGNEFQDSDPSNAMLDPNDVTLRFIDLTATHSYWSNRVPRVSGTPGSRFKSVWNANVYYPYYYTTPVAGRPDWNDPKTKIEILPANAPFDGGPERDDCFNPTACTYAEELQNFANWFTYYRIREHSAKGALGVAVSDASNVRMGYAAMNQSQERLRIDTLNSSFRVGHKKDLMDQIYRTRSNGGTPLRRALDRAGRHFQCISGDSFGSSGSSAPGTTNCPVLADPEGQCQNNFALLFSDGTWNGGFSGAGAADHDSDSPSDVSPSPFDGGRYADNRSSTLADVAMYYYERDLQPGLVDGVPTNERDRNGANEAVFGNDGETMHQHMKTYTVGFGLAGSIDLASVPLDYSTPFVWSNPFNGGASKVDDMLHAAVNGRGDFLQANNPVLLSAAFQQAFAEFSDGSVSVSAVAFNSTALREETVEYRGFFNLKFNSGDLRALSVDPDTGVVDVDNPIWRAAPELDLVDPDDRVIVTYDRVAQDGIPFRYGNLNVDQQTVVDAQELAFLRGDRSNEEPGGTFRERRVTEGLLGDIVHSAPVYVGQPRAIQRDAAPYPTSAGDLYSAFVDDQDSRQAAVYVAANDGMLHAFNAGIPGTNLGDGSELFAYVPNKIIDGSQRFQNELDQLSSLVYSHKFFVDLTPTIEDVYMPATATAVGKSWNTILIGGLGAGGKGYYALNITDPDDWDTEANASNRVLWEFTDADDFYPVDNSGDPLEDPAGDPLVDLAGDPVKDLGYTFSLPQIVMSNVEDADGEQQWIAVFGNGYNSTAGIAKLFALFIGEGMDGWSADEVIKLDTGEGVKSAPDPLAGLPNGLGTPTVIDADLNGTADYVYAGDLFGNLYRFDITDGDTDNWTTTKLFQATYDETIDTRQATINKPTVVRNPAGEGFIVIFGTGSFVTEQDGTSTDIQSLYGIWDRFEVSPATAASNAKSTRLVEQELTNLVVESGFAFNRLRVVTENEVAYAPDSGGTPGVYGWYVDFDPVRPSSTDQGNPNPDSTGNAPPDAQYPGERAVRRLVIRNGVVIVVSILPREENTCFRAPPGNVMAFDAVTGGNPSQAVFDLNADGEVDDNDLIDYNGESFAGGILLDPNDLDGTLVDPSILSGTGDTDFLFLSGGSEQQTIEIFGLGGPKTGRLSWRELNDGL